MNRWAIWFASNSSTPNRQICKKRVSTFVEETLFYGGIHDEGDVIVFGF